MSDSFYDNPEPYVGTAAKLLLSQGKFKAANVLAASTLENVDSVQYECRYENDSENYYTLHSVTVLINVSSDIFFQISEDIGDLEAEISNAIGLTLRGRNFDRNRDEYAFSGVTISVLNLDAADWRSEVRKILLSDGVSNQGRVRSDNIAPFEHKGLLFRSPPEIGLFDALTRKGMLFAPLPTFIRNDLGNRIEPDFIVFKDGISLLIEVDGRSYHRESPVDAQNRLNAFTAQGVESFRVDAGRLNSASDADSVVKEIEEFIERRRNLRR